MKYKLIEREKTARLKFAVKTGFFIRLTLC